MRVKNVRLAWFRGAAEAVPLDLGGKSAVIYGENGAGKSSFVDAIEFVLHSGKLNHLSHEYSGRNQEKAIPNTHAPDGSATELWVQFADDAELNIKIARNGTHTKAGIGATKMDGWDYGRTVLRQDEVAAFIHSRKGDKYSALLPLFGLHELEVAAENLRQLVPAVEKQSQLSAKQATLKVLAPKRKQIFGDDDDAAIEVKVAALHEKYCPDSTTIAPADQCSEAEAALNQRVTDLSEDKQRYLALRALATSGISVAVEVVREANGKLAGSAELLITEKLQVLQSAQIFAGKLTEGDEIACPACGQNVTVTEFQAHIKAEQERLAEIIASFNERKTAIATLIDALKAFKNTLGKAELKDWNEAMRAGPLKVNLEWLDGLEPERLRQAITEDGLTAIDTHCAPIIAEADRLSQNAPPEIKELNDDLAAITTAKAVFEGKALAKEIARIEGIVAFLQELETGTRKEIRERCESVIADISIDIGTMWSILHPGEPIENVHLYLPEDDKAIDIALKFYGKEQDSPRLTLSEGYRNALGLCIFLAMAKREAANDRPLFMDDVVVSFDRNHRGMIVELLQKEFGNRQVVIFTHDRDWYAELRKLLDERQWIFRTLLPYEAPTIGIRWSHKTTTFDDARAHLKDRPDSAGNDARKIMDVELALIAEQLKVELPYRRGEGNDHRMAHEFLERIVSDGKKCLQKKSGDAYPVFTNGITALDAAQRLIAAWGNRGSHSFDVVRPEATKLIDTCEAALDVFECKGCGNHLWLADAANREWVQCQCGELRWRYGKV